MTPATYVISAVLVFVFSGLLAMAGLGAAFLFVPLSAHVPYGQAGRLRLTTDVTPAT
jgi:hypothetical protein